jgi:quercetin dioxygenase-like cupin family protein
MRTKIGTVVCLGAALVAIVMAAPGKTQNEGIARPISAVKFEQDEDVKCLRSALESGNPASGASTFILKASAKCVVPWHYHTAEEQLVVIQGSVLTEMDGMSASTLGSGGFALMLSKKRHAFSCGSGAECLMVVSFDRPYDIFWDKEKH